MKNVNILFETLIVSTLFAVCAFGELEVGIESAVELSADVSSSKVYVVEQTTNLLDASAWESLDVSYLTFSNHTARWYMLVDSPQKTFRLVERDAEYVDYAMDYMDQVADTMPESMGSFIDWIKKEIAALVRVAVKDRLCRSIVYKTHDAEGMVQKVSGLITAPNTPATNSWPMILYQHPTQVVRMYSPSHASVNILDDQLAWFLADVMRMCGFIVLEADYPGMGVNLNVHPYCHESIANSVIDMIPAATNFLAEVAPNIQWNGDLYLMGYSEGGYVTMVTAKKMQEDYPGRFDIKYVYCMDAPLCLSGTMRELMLDATADYSAPYFLPYFISAYSEIYSDTIPEIAFTNSIVNNVSGYTNYPAYLRARLNGDYTSEEISAIIRKVVPYEGPSSAMTPQIIAELEDLSSDLYQVLNTNNAYNAFNPEIPVKLYHNELDDCVPYGNSTNAMAYFDVHATHTTPELVSYTAYIDGLGSIHAGSFPIAFSLAFLDLYIHAYLEE